MSGKTAFTPSGLDSLRGGTLSDPLTPGLSIEVLARGKKKWRYERRLVGGDGKVKMSLGLYPAHGIAAAREWARALNDLVEVGVDPREVQRAAEERASMTVAKAHGLYIEAAREGRASRAKRKNKPRTISDKLKIYHTDIEPKLGKTSIYAVTERDLIKLVQAKGRTAKVRANRLAAELGVFFGWASSLRGLEVGLEDNPARRLADLRFPEAPRKRKLSLEEIGWYLRAVADEEDRDFRRGFVLFLLTAVRFSELTKARRVEVERGIWTIPSKRSKNSSAHAIALGPWAAALMMTNSEWIFPAPRVDGPRTQGWYEARDRILKRMADYAGHPIEHFVPHDLRRTMRSNTRRLKIDFETAEAMLNHLKSGMERIYDGYEHEEEMAASFLRWEEEVGRLARAEGVAERLELPAVRIDPPRSTRMRYRRDGKRSQRDRLA
ncbi:integrase arm-type DNA-binding domain-containing protein [Sphingopyxis sp. DHUNG17]|uniref:tyrosine-type recombinase/integrase n=1 Tax=Sphingopyxis jiangsuensis TaxID=2871171 RepID=UPI00191CC1AB|nr:integrase arm-type DNA-binding domain-containing protein [Sphingopyxis lutea]MBL0770005.1 integrase arm-type DNA-binding domain-containing protein [Sphingopyxis lutea]